MVVFCVETINRPEVKMFANKVSGSLSQVTVKNFFFKRTSFAYLVEEKKRFIIIVNLEAIVVPLPRWFVYWVFKKGLRKAGYKDKTTLVNNGEVFGLIIKRVKQWRKKK